MQHFVIALIKYVSGIIEGLLGLRVVLKYLGANGSAPVVKFLYDITNFFVAPFKNIFADFVFGRGALDLTAASAIIGYAILLFILIKLLKLFIR